MRCGGTFAVEAVAPGARSTLTVIPAVMVETLSQLVTAAVVHSLTTLVYVYNSVYIIYKTGLSCSLLQKRLL